MLGKKGSLVLSLMASGVVAATIMATHQVAQNFASGAAQGLNQQQAFILAQKSIALATLMVQKNVVICSNAQIGNENDGWKKQVRGCYQIGPLPREDLDGNSNPNGVVNKIAHDFYDSLGLLGQPPSGKPSWFKTVNLPSPYNNQMEGKAYLVFNPLDTDLKNDYHTLFKNAEITWAVRNANDPSVRAALSIADKGVICRDTRTLLEVDGLCPYAPPTKEDDDYPLDMRLNYAGYMGMPSVLCKIKDSNGQYTVDGAHTVCDYYPVQDSDDSMVFVSVVVPYQVSKDVKKQKIVMNAAVRRPFSTFHIRPIASESCAMKCESAYNEHYDNEYPRCVGLSDYNTIQNAAVLGNYPKGTQLLRKELKVLNKGPGVLFDIALKREDLDRDTKSSLGQHIVRAREFASGSSPRPVGPGGSRVIQDLIPCYYSSYYEVNVKRMNCTCRQRRIGTLGTDVTGPDGSVCRGTLTCDGVIQGPHVVARASGTSVQPFSCPAPATLPALANSQLTAVQALCQRNNWPGCSGSAISLGGCMTSTRPLPGGGSTPPRFLSNVFGAGSLATLPLSR